jgi:hypothetical protein
MYEGVLDAPSYILHFANDTKYITYYLIPIPQRARWAVGSREIRPLKGSWEASLPHPNLGWARYSQFIRYLDFIPYVFAL